MVRIGEAARRCGVCVDTIRRWGKNGRIRVLRLPTGERRIAEDELARVLQQIQNPTRPQPIASGSSKPALPIGPAGR